MGNRAIARSLAIINRKRMMLDQQLDQYSTGETIHLVANLKATYLLVTGLYCKREDRESFSLVTESEAEIRAFVTRAKSQLALFS